MRKEVMQNNEVNPLNVSTKRYEELFENELPSEMNAFITFFFIGAPFPLPEDPREEQICNGMVSILNSGHQITSLSNLVSPTPTIYLNTFATPEFDFLVDSNCPVQQAWILDGLFIDLAFSTNPEPDEIQKLGGLVGMRLLNQWNIAFGSVEPPALSPLVLPNLAPSVYGEIVGDVFENEVFVWTKVLAQIRTQWLVMARAVLMGRDPHTELKRFISAGGKSHFDYPFLCP